MKLVKFAIRLVAGIIFGLACALALTPALAAFSGSSDSMGGDGQIVGAIIFWGIVAVAALLGALAPTIRRAFGRGFLLVGASVFALPMSTVLLSGRVASDMINQASTSDQAFTAIGAGAAGVMMTGVAGFFGFILGTVLIVVGLVLSLGGRREVVAVGMK